MLALFLACVSTLAAPDAGKVSLKKDLISKLAGKRVEMGIKQPPGHLPAVLVGEFSDAKSWSPWSKQFRGAIPTVDFAKQKLVFVLPWSEADNLTPLSGAQPGQASFLFAESTKDSIAADVHGFLWAIDRAASMVKIDLVTRGGETQAVLGGGAPAFARTVPSLVSLEDSAKLPGKSIEIDKLGKVVVAEITTQAAFAPWAKSLHDVSGTVDFSKQKIWLVMPTSDDLSPLPGGPVARFLRQSPTHFVAQTARAGYLWVVDQSVNRVAIEVVLPAATQNVNLH